MMFILKILLSIFFVALVAAHELGSKSEEKLDAQHLEYEKQHEAKHEEKRPIKATRKQTTIPSDVSPPVVEKRCQCIPYEDYVKILKLNFQNETVELRSEENYYQSCAKIDQHNEMYNQWLFTYMLGKNHLIHQAFEDAKENLCGLALPQTSRALNYRTTFSKYPVPTGKAEFEKSFCHFHQPVRDQDSCGSCWAFSVVAVLEALYSRYKGITTCASEQMLVDCDKRNYGCDGGWPPFALEYIKQFGLSDCRYTYANREEMCKKRSFKRSVQPSVINYVEVELNGDEDLLKRIIAAKGPVAGVMHIAESIYNYASGVYLDDTCLKSADDVNHAIVICGYGVDPLYGPYWIVRNSWSPYWGELGYVKIARGRNTCGIASTIALYAEFV